MQFHHWRYIRERYWSCEICKGTTDNPNKGTASKPSCPGPSSTKKRH